MPPCAYLLASIIYFIPFLFMIGRVLREVSLNEPIRYAVGDPVEKWLHGLLCLNAANIPRLVSGCPPPQDCELYPISIYIT